MVKEFAAVWVVADVLHSEYSGVVFSFDNLNWVLAYAVAKLYQGNVTSGNSCRAVAMLTGQVLQYLRKPDCGEQDRGKAYAHKEDARTKHISQYMYAKALDGTPGDGLSQFVLEPQAQAWDFFLATLTEVLA